MESSLEHAKDKLKKLLQPLYEAAKLEWGTAQEDYADEICEQIVSGALVATVHKCPECGFTPVTTKVLTDKFTYKTDKGTAQLSYKLPLRHCETCGFEWSDYEGEILKTDAINVYLKSCKEPGWKTRRK